MKVTRKDYSIENETIGKPSKEGVSTQIRKYEFPAWVMPIVFVALPLFLGIVIGLLNGNAPVELLERIKLPPLSPQVEVMQASWLGYYILMGIASYLVMKSDSASVRKRRALIAYGIQLVIGLAWTPVFFLAEAFEIAVGISILLMVSIAVTMDFFTRCSSVSGKLLVPCLLWSSFLSYLSLGVALLN